MWHAHEYCLHTWKTVQTNESDHQSVEMTCILTIGLTLHSTPKISLIWKPVCHSYKLHQQAVSPKHGDQYIKSSRPLSKARSYTYNLAKPMRLFKYLSHVSAQNQISICHFIHNPPTLQPITTTPPARILGSNIESKDRNPSTSQF